MHDVAELASVSAKTVLRVFNGEQHVTDKTRAKVERAMQELNFVPNMLARSFRVGYDRAVGVAIPDIADPFFAAMTRAIEDVALSRQMGVVISSLGRDPARERQVLQALLHRSIVGLIAVPIGEDQSYLAPWQQRTPVVFVDRYRRRSRPTALSSTIEQARWRLRCTCSSRVIAVSPSSEILWRLRRPGSDLRISGRAGRGRG